jgi:hypothetical protein
MGDLNTGVTVARRVRIDNKFAGSRCLGEENVRKVVTRVTIQPRISRIGLDLLDDLSPSA